MGTENTCGNRKHQSGKTKDHLKGKHQSGNRKHQKLPHASTRQSVFWGGRVEVSGSGFGCGAGRGRLRFGSGFGCGEDGGDGQVGKR